MSKSIPFELPVKVEILPIKVADYDRPYSIVGRTVESVGEIYAYLGNKDRADYIVQAINSHEKLVNVCRNALTSLAITMLPRLDNNVASDNDIIKIVISSLEQALEAEKT